MKKSFTCINLLAITIIQFMPKVKVHTGLSINDVTLIFHLFDIISMLCKLPKIFIFVNSPLCYDGLNNKLTIKAKQSNQKLPDECHE